MIRLPQIFQKLQMISPKLAARAALFLFTHPMPTAIRSPAERRLAARAQEKLREARREDIRSGPYRIATYRFARTAADRRGTALLVHGWTSAAAYMTAPVDNLCAMGFDVVAFDMPAHGKSSGRKAEMIDCALALAVVATRHGPIDQIIAHSFGGPMTTLALACRLSPALTGDTRLLFIASPNRLADVTEQFSRALGLGEEARRMFESALVAPLGVDVDALDGNLLLADCENPLTIIHSRDDSEVAYEAAEKFARLGDRVQLRPLEGLGHRRILHAQPSISAIMDSIGA